MTGPLPRSLLGGALLSALLLATPQANAQAAPPAGHDEEAFDFMNLMTDMGIHDIKEESWNAYGQFTYISNWKLPYSARYTNANGSTNSLYADSERSFTGSFTAFVGIRLWPGAEAYLVPEVIAERPLSNLKGLGGSIQNFELQKGGSETPQLYRSRLFLRQTVGLGGTPIQKSSDPMQLGTKVDSRRLVFTAGNFSILDVFSRNSVTWDPRQTFLNMAFMTYSSWDFTSDARGYSWGGTAELYWDEWAMRFGRITPPKKPNQLPQEFRLDKFYGDNLELQHDHELLGQPGAIRIVAYRNQTETGRFDEAILVYKRFPVENNAKNCGDRWSYKSGNAQAPDLCFVRRTNEKFGIGLDVEQYLTRDIGLFFRGMYSDGKTEVDAFNPADSSISFGAVAKGGLWGRPLDVTGIGFASAWISDEHAQFLAMGGIDGFVGDGSLSQAPESVFDVFYSVNLWKALWLSADYQHIWNPGFNADRGEVNIISGRVHAEF